MLSINANQNVNFGRNIFKKHNSDKKSYEQMPADLGTDTFTPSSKSNRNSVTKAFNRAMIGLALLGGTMSTAPKMEAQTKEPEPKVITKQLFSHDQKTGEVNAIFTEYLSEKPSLDSLVFVPNYDKSKKKTIKIERNNGNFFSENYQEKFTTPDDRGFVYSNNTSANGVVGKQQISNQNGENKETISEKCTIYDSTPISLRTEHYVAPKEDTDNNLLDPGPDYNLHKTATGFVKTVVNENPDFEADYYYSPKLVVDSIETDIPTKGIKGMTRVTRDPNTQEIKHLDCFTINGARSDYWREHDNFGRVTKEIINNPDNYSEYEYKLPNVEF